MDFLVKMLLPRMGTEKDGTEDLSRYRRIWWRTVAMTLVVTLSPLLVMLGVNYYLFQRAFNSSLKASFSALKWTL